MKSSSFLSPKVLVHTQSGTTDITDSVDDIFVQLSQESPFQTIKVKIKMNTLKVLEHNIGFFKERYSIYIDIFDINRKSVQDTFKIVNASPISYPNLDISELSQTLKNDAHASAGKSNVKDVEFLVELINEHTENAGIMFSYIWDQQVTYKKVWDKLTSKLSPWVEKDEPYLPDVTFYPHYFVPYNRMYNIIPSTMLDGYIKPKDGMGAFFILESGYAAYNMKGSFDRPKIKTTIYPTKASMKNFKDIFVTGFEISRDPSLKFEYGTNVRTIGSNQWMGGFKINDRELNYKDKEEILFKGIFDGTQATAMRFYKPNNTLDDKMIITSMHNIFRQMNKLTITLNRWTNFAMFIPLRHQWDIKFSSDVLKPYSGIYYVHGYELSVTREKQEFIPLVKLDLRIFNI